MLEEYENLINTVMEVIDKYLAGDELYYNEILTIAKGSLDSIKANKEHYWKFYLYKYYFIFSLLIHNKSVLEEDFYKEFMKSYDENLEYFKTSSDKVYKYAQECFKCEDFSHLKDVYMLSLYLALLLESISGYRDYIVSFVNSIERNFVYLLPSNHRDKENNILKLIASHMENIPF